ncbi:MAG: ferritin family protein [Bacillota bacterium]
MNSNLKVLEYALSMEKNGHNFYKENSKKAKDKNAKKVLASLAEIEKEHAEMIKEFMKKLKKDKDMPEINLSDGNQIFENELQEANFNVEKMDGSDLAIMRMAYLIENDFSKFYEKAAKKAKDKKVKNLLEKLADWENNHRDIFYNEFKDLMEDNWFEQNFYPF